MGACIGNSRGCYRATEWGKDQEADQRKHGRKVLQGMQGDSGLGVNGGWKLTEMSGGRKLKEVGAQLLAVVL